MKKNEYVESGCSLGKSQHQLYDWVLAYFYERAWFAGRRAWRLDFYETNKEEEGEGRLYVDCM